MRADGTGGPVLGDQGKAQPADLGDFLVRVEDHSAGGVVDESYGQAKAELAQFGFGQLAAPEPLPPPVPFRFAHGTLQAQEQAIIVLAGIVDAFLVTDQCRHAATPVRGVLLLNTLPSRGT